ncbi:MAG: CHAT domain-containing protein [Blastocatellales bacterium]
MARLRTTGERLNQAFQLAYFIHADEVVARDIAARAVSLLDANMVSQDKRLAHESEHRNTVTLNEDHMLQRLVMISSLEREIERERDLDRIDEDALLVHFLAHLVRITGKLTPFHTTLAVCRILHNYNTPETQEIDRVVMQDPGGGKDPSFFRARKKVLIDELQDRFGNLIKQFKGPNQEIRFIPHDHPGRFLELTNICLKTFSPWFISCIKIPPDYNPSEQILDDLTSENLSEDETQRIQLKRMHAVLDPDCFSLLIEGLRVYNMKKLKFDKPEDTLEIPAFNISSLRPPGDSRRPGASSEHELDEKSISVIQRKLEVEASVRKKWDNGLLSVVVDGRERTVIDPGGSGTAGISLDGGEELIEIFDAESGVLLAAKLLSYDDDLRITEPSFALGLPDQSYLCFDFEAGDAAPDSFAPYTLKIGYQAEPVAAREAERKEKPGKGFWQRVMDLASIRRPAVPLLATAALLIMVGVGYQIWRERAASPVQAGLTALYDAYQGRRPFESRITGLAYSRFSTTRGGPAEGPDPARLRRAENTLLEAVDGKDTSASRYALGMMYLLNRDLDKAIPELYRAAELDSRNPLILSDLGAALLENGKKKKAAGDDSNTLDFSRSNNQLTTALGFRPDMPEALFNRALCRELLGLDEQAIEDWERYLRIDPSSKWADEARARLNGLREAMKDRSQLKEQKLRQFLAARNRNDREAAWNAIKVNRELITGSIIWQQLLNDFFRRSKDPPGARDALDAMGYAGAVEEEKTGDTFVSDLARYYSSRSGIEIQKLAAAHDLMQQGNSQFLIADFKAASRNYLEATKIYDSLGDRQESLISRYLNEYCNLVDALNKEPSELFKLLGEAKYPWVKAQIHNALGSVYTSIAQPSEGIRQTTLALELSEKTQDPLGIQRNQCELAVEHHRIGAREKAVEYLGKCLGTAAVTWPGYRQIFRYYTSANQIFLEAHDNLTAEAFSLAAFSLARDVMKDPAFIYSSAIRLADSYKQSHRYDEAARMYQTAYKTARDHSHIVAFRTRWAMVAGLLGDFYYDRKQYGEAIKYFNESIELHTRENSVVSLHSGLKGRFLAHIAAGNDRDAYEDLKEIRRSTENYRKHLSNEGYRNSFFRREQEFADAAIDFLIDRRDDEYAFNFSESTRARSLLDLISTRASVSSNSRETDFLLESVSTSVGLSEIQAALPANVLLVQYAVLRDRVVIWAVSRDGRLTRTSTVSQRELRERVNAYKKKIADYRNPDYSVTAVNAESEWFYSLLIAPVENQIKPGTHLCIIPDKALNFLPFLTLRKPGSGKYLVERSPVSFMPGSTIFVHCTRRAAELQSKSAGRDERLLSIGISTLDSRRYANLDPLFRAGEEARRIAAFYPDSAVLVDGQAEKSRVIAAMGRADVVHIASHYVVDKTSPTKSKLLLSHESVGAGSAEKNSDTLQAEEIYAEYARLAGARRTRLAVLSSCDSGIESYLEGEGMIGMSRIFIASDIPLVVASLWKVDTDATETLMVAFHGYRKQKPMSVNSAEALRQAQRYLIATGDGKYARPGYWAGFVLIGGYASF